MRDTKISYVEINRVKILAKVEDGGLSKKDLIERLHNDEGLFGFKEVGDNQSHHIVDRLGTQCQAEITVLNVN